MRAALRRPRSSDIASASFHLRRSSQIMRELQEACGQNHQRVLSHMKVPFNAWLKEMIHRPDNASSVPSTFHSHVPRYLVITLLGSRNLLPLLQQFLQTFPGQLCDLATVLSDGFLDGDPEGGRVFVSKYQTIEMPDEKTRVRRAFIADVHEYLIELTRAPARPPDRLGDDAVGSFVFYEGETGVVTKFKRKGGGGEGEYVIGMSEREIFFDQKMFERSRKHLKKFFPHLFHRKIRLSGPRSRHPCAHLLLPDEATEKDQDGDRKDGPSFGRGGANVRDGTLTYSDFRHPMEGVKEGYRGPAIHLVHLCRTVDIEGYADPHSPFVQLMRSPSFRESLKNHADLGSGAKRLGGSSQRRSKSAGPRAC
uniref:Uncharacterized protein n=1 Tax=Chromera velia CCMP2878 TaxID=1169474 RepID=A0A0G4G3H7_9ALVE|eukprot:Cvel_20055.t1-p1 / transcript=Cvel_20055.t1 / gene=Cvel_20055 / organism=Chromera_velia_CCMP2878 / gene_product=hypothetical protein / transcript_product=hypothetical protein / location=Cvel_scaffold1773:12863-16304(+) / protein_length=365 / sequence_SO=supercontig / SO=protein_coding / is_pseudo=false